MRVGALLPRAHDLLVHHEWTRLLGLVVGVGGGGMGGKQMVLYISWNFLEN